MHEVTITIAGNVVGEVRSGRTADGTSRSNFKIAHNSRRWDKTVQRWVDVDAQFFHVTCWRELADNVRASLRKGMPVIVQGRLSTREVTTDCVNAAHRTIYVDVDAHHVAVDLLRGIVRYESTKSLAVLAAEDRAVDEAMRVAGLSA